MKGRFLSRVDPNYPHNAVLYEVGERSLAGFSQDRLDGATAEPGGYTRGPRISNGPICISLSGEEDGG